MFIRIYFKEVDKSVSPTFKIFFRTAPPDDSDPTICRQPIKSSPKRKKLIGFHSLFRIEILLFHGWAPSEMRLAIGTEEYAEVIDQFLGSDVDERRDNRLAIKVL